MFSTYHAYSQERASHAPKAARVPGQMLRQMGRPVLCHGVKKEQGKISYHGDDGEPEFSPQDRNEQRQAEMDHGVGQQPSLTVMSVTVRAMVIINSKV